MDLYVLNYQFDKVALVDDYISLIWTERYNTYGDFQLDIKSTVINRQTFPRGVRLSIPESKRVMVVETIEDNLADDGTALLQIKGRSLEKILEDRLAWMGILPVDQINQKWPLGGAPTEIARYIFDVICVDGLISVYDIIPDILTTSIFPEDTIPEPDSVDVLLDPDTLYNTLTKLAETYNFGIRLVRETDTDQLYFNIYTGVDRTTLQDDVEAIIFSPDLDNMFNTSELISDQGVKNVAYVISSRGALIVYPPDVDPTISGLDRRVLFVNVDVPDDVEYSTGPPVVPAVTYDVEAVLTQAGLDALAAAQGLRAFDGEVRFPEALIYGTGFNLGDLVELRNRDGDVTYKRVTEYIFSSDAEGERAYPTLTETLIGGLIVWSSILEGQTWFLFDDEVWDDF